MNFLIHSFALFLRFTYRFRYYGQEYLNDLDQRGQNYIMAIWHQSLLAGILAQKNKSFTLIISRSKDANPVAYTCAKFGHKVARGSSKKNGVDKGGQEAKNEMIEWLKRGYPGAITVDGPKGPAFQVKPGVINMAIESQSVIVPYTIKPRRYIQFNSWDKFRLPLPFSLIEVHYGRPMELAPQKDFEAQRLELEVLLKKALAD